MDTHTILRIIQNKMRAIETLLSATEPGHSPSRFSSLLAQRQLCKDLLIELQATTPAKETLE
jgi:hypothetical protein